MPYWTREQETNLKDMVDDGKSIEQLSELFHRSQEDEYVSRVARTTTDACELVDVGFEYVCEIDGEKIFRKRK